MTPENTDDAFLRLLKRCDPAGDWAPDATAALAACQIDVTGNDQDDVLFGREGKNAGPQSRGGASVLRIRARYGPFLSVAAVVVAVVALALGTAVGRPSAHSGSAGRAAQAPARPSLTSSPDSNRTVQTPAVRPPNSSTTGKPNSHHKVPQALSIATKPSRLSGAPSTHSRSTGGATKTPTASKPTSTARPTPSPTLPTVTAYRETTGSLTHTWSDYVTAGGTAGWSIPAYTTVKIECAVIGFKVADGNTWWYRIAAPPWNGDFYASADAFYNNGQTSGSLHGTPFVDPLVPRC